LARASAVAKDGANLCAALVIAFAVLHALRWSFLCDDAYISFRYATNLAEHGELAFNVAPLERVEGYTNFAWVVVLAATAAIGLAPEHVAPVLGLASLAVTAVLVAHLLRTRRLEVDADAVGGDDRWTVVVALGLVAAVPEIVVWGTSGLETAFAAAWVMGAIAAFVAWRPALSAACAAAAVLSRPDTALGLGVWLVAHLAVHHRRWWDHPRRAATCSPRRLALASAWLVVPIAVHLLWRRSYYGTWLPNTWAIKAHGAALRDTWGTAYVEQWARAMWLPYLLPLLPWLRRSSLPLLASAAAVVAYGWSVGGDFMAYSRFFVVPTLMLALVVGAALAECSRWLAAHGRRWSLAPSFVGTVAVALLARDADARFRVDRSKPEGWLDGKWEGVTAMARFAEVGRAAGTWLREHVPADTLITVGAAGAVPYASRLPTVDAFGLVDPEMAAMDPPPLRTGPGVRPGHQLFAPVEYIRRRGPSLLCHVGFRGASPPREADARSPFRSGYAWACAVPGPGTAHGPDGPFDPGVYCCRRPLRTIVGPFGRAVGPASFREAGDD
jgi:arabinofuranosyltransferase